MITNQKALRRRFWEEHPTLNRKRAVQMGDEKVYVTDTRCAFADWIDGLQKAGEISEALAFRAHLER